MELLLQDYPTTTPASFQERRHRLSALAYEQLADFINAAEARISYNTFLPQGADKEANTAKIWDDLNKVDKETPARISPVIPAGIVRLAGACVYQPDDVG